MKPYGRQHQHPGNLPDRHPPKGHVNWWEVEEHNGKSKKRERQRANTEVEELIQLCEENAKKVEFTSKEKCKSCFNYELVLNRNHYCHLFGKSIKDFKNYEIELNHCFVFDEQKEIQRIEAKAW